MAKKAHVVYTERGFRQDAAQAMRSQIHRALIELITNSDDAYGDLPGDIRVNVLEGKDDFSSLVVVSDNAIGLDATGMSKCFGEIGSKNSKLANGGKSRGLLGRGAKDVAVFGKVHFESIKNGKYSDLELDARGDITIESEDAKAEDQHYAALGIPEGSNGLKATIYVAKANELAKPAELLKQLRNNAQLRDLIANRPVIFSDYRSPESNGRLETTLPAGTLIKSLQVKLDGFEGDAEIAFFKLDEIQPAAAGETTANGILVKSGRTIFENTWFSLDRPETRRVAGYIDAPQIEEALRAEIDSEEPAAVSLLSRSRDGLTRAHKLYDSIARAVKLAVHPILDELAAESGSQQKQGEKLTQDLKVAAQAIKNDILSILREFDDEPPVIDGGDALGEFEAIPAVLVLRPGQASTVTLRATEEVSELDVVATASGPEVTPVDEGFGKAFKPKWVKHTRLERFVAQWQFTAPKSVGLYPVVFKAGDNMATVQVVVREGSITPPTPPKALEFRPAKATASPGRGKNLQLRAPIEYAGESILISTTGVDLAQAPEKVTLRANSDGSWVEAVVHLKTSALKGVAEIIAKATDGEEAKAELTVAEAGASGAGPIFEFELKGDNSLTRYSMDENNGSFTCYVYGQHPSFCGVFGKYSETEGKFISEDEPVARAVMAEAIAQAFAQQLVEIEFGKRPEDSWDPVRALTKSRAYVDKLVRTLHQALVG
jgi:hypothetical protein